MTSLAEEIDLITVEMKALREAAGACNVSSLNGKIKELDEIIGQNISLLCKSMLLSDREQIARLIGYTIKKQILQNALDNMIKLEHLQYKLQDKEEAYLLNKHKILMHNKYVYIDK